MSIVRSNLPALINAGSSTSDIFVAPKTMIFVEDSKPSNSDKNWFNV